MSTYSKQGHGTRVVIHVPAIAGGQRRLVEPGNEPLAARRKHLVLFVDDEAAIRSLTKTMLEANGYRVLVADGGIRAMDLYVQHADQIDVVVTDMMMPVLDGSTTIRALQEINPKVRIIAVSGLPENQAKAESSGTGIQGFLQKPYTTARLLAALKEAIATPGHARRILRRLKDGSPLVDMCQ
jgi:two-component system cell cycle sensor histidine kinase/response regulator CckA